MGLGLELVSALGLGSLVLVLVPLVLESALALVLVPYNQNHPEATPKSPIHLLLSRFLSFAYFTPSVNF
jgi:hypothetical protein